MEKSAKNQREGNKTVIQLSYHFVGIGNENARISLDRAFDTLFEETHGRLARERQECGKVSIDSYVQLGVTYRYGISHKKRGGEILSGSCSDR